MERAILEQSESKLVIMVTHDLDLAAQMDTIVYMRGGVETPTVMNNEQFMSHLEELRGSLLKES